MPKFKLNEIVIEKTNLLQCIVLYSYFVPSNKSWSYIILAGNPDYYTDDEVIRDKENITHISKKKKKFFILGEKDIIKII